MSNKNFSTLKEENVTIEITNTLSSNDNETKKINNNKFYSYELNEFIKTINLINADLTPCLKKYGKKILIYSITTILAFCCVIFSVVASSI